MVPRMEEGRTSRGENLQRVRTFRTLEVDLWGLRCAQTIG